MQTTQSLHPLIQKAETLGQRLQMVEEVKRFQAAEQQIEQSETVKKYIEQIKQKQKELVHAKHYQKTEYRKQLEEDLEELNQRFDQLPIVQEYQQCQVSVNDLLQTIQQIIADTLSKKLDVETGGEVASGCGSGGACGCAK